MKAINSLVEAFVEPIKFTATFLDKVATGDANISKTTKEYKGDFNDIKNNINATVDTLLLFLGELSELSDGAQAGNLSKRADCSKAKGA
jgi:methyl-accepting chemotaxis protein